MDGSKKWREPIVSNFTMSIEKDNNIPRGGECSVIPGSYQPLPLRIPHKLHFGIIWLLDLLLQLVVQMLKLRLVVHQDNLV